MKILGIVAAAAGLLAQDVRRDVLLLLPAEPARISSVATLEGLRLGLAKAMPGQTLVAAEHSPGGAGEEQWFPVKHGQRRVDLIVAVSEGVYLRALKYRERFWPGVPVVYLINGRAGVPLPPRAPNTVPLDVSASPLESAQLAVQLFPKTRRLALIAGDTPAERRIGSLWASQLRSALPGREVTEWAGLTAQELREQARTLPSDSVVLIGLFAQDLRGMPATHESLTSMLAPVSAAPILDWLPSGVGVGAVGGYVFDLRVAGEEAAALAVRIFRGEAADSIPPQLSKLGSYQFDSRQLQRFGIDESRLPAGSQVRFRTPTLWESHGPLITAAYVAFVLLSLLLGILLVERRRRRRSQLRLSEQLHFETLVAETSASFMEQRGYDQTAVIRQALQRLAECARASAAVFESSAGAPRRLAWPPAEPAEPVAISVPLFLDGAEAGILSLRSTRAQAWDGWTQRLRTFGELMLNATARHSSAEQAERNRALNQSMLDSLEGLVVTVDAAGIVIFCNKGREALPNLPQFTVGRPYLDAWRLSAYPEVTAELQEYCGDSSPRFRLEFNPAPRCWIEIQCEPLDRPERGCMVMHRDITSQRLAELERASLVSELAHRNRVSALGEFSSSIAHEITQPLTAIVSNGESAHKLLTEPQPDLDELREVIRDVVSDGRRAAAVISHMRTLLQKGRSFELKPVRLAQLARETLRLVEADAITRGVRLTVELSEEATAVADPVQLQQVLLNLLVNAFDSVAMRAGADRQVWVRTQCREFGGRLEVEDSGPGVAEADRETIFQQFYTTKAEGLGIGLAISRRLVSTMGGCLWVETGALGGAKFCVEISAAPGDAKSRSGPP